MIKVWVSLDELDGHHKFIVLYLEASLAVFKAHLFDMLG